MAGSAKPRGVQISLDAAGRKLAAPDQLAANHQLAHWYYWGMPIVIAERR